MYVTTNKVASVLPIMISADKPQNNLKERNRQRTRTVIRVISCSANFTKCPFTLLTFSRFLSASPYSGLFHSLSIDAKESRVLVRKNNFRHAILSDVRNLFALVFDEEKNPSGRYLDFKAINEPLRH